MNNEFIGVDYDALEKYSRDLQAIIETVEGRFKDVEKAFDQLTSPEVFNEQKLEEFRQVDTENFDNIRKVIDDAREVLFGVNQRLEAYRAWRDSLQTGQ